MKDALLSYLAQSGEAILSYYRKNPPFSLAPGELAEGTFAYFERGGKRLRPAICRLSAGIFGGDKAQEDAVPCALALQLDLDPRRYDRPRRYPPGKKRRA